MNFIAPGDRPARLQFDWPTIDVRSRVGGSEVWVLRMTKHQERAELLRDRLALESADTFTEMAISDLHESSLRVLTSGRLDDYLS